MQSFFSYTTYPCCTLYVRILRIDGLPLKRVAIFYLPSISLHETSLFSPLTHRALRQASPIQLRAGAEKCSGTTFRFARMCTRAAHDRFYQVIQIKKNIALTHANLGNLHNESTGEIARKKRIDFGNKILARRSVIKGKIRNLFRTPYICIFRRERPKNCRAQVTCIIII